MSAQRSHSPHVIVIGAGIGGLTAAALLAKAGYRVSVFEAQTYPGGCASTFFHKGFRFESGATVVGGFQPNGPHAIIGKQMDIKWPVHPHEPAWVTHLPHYTITLTRDNNDVVTKFPDTEKFWKQQSRLADLAWKMSAVGLPWPPRSVTELSQLVRVAAAQFPQDLQMIPFVFSNVRDWLRWHGLHTNEAFVRFLDAQLLISAQTTTRHANALYAATALDLPRQGLYHIEGGIGSIAQALADKLQNLGGKIHYRHYVERIAVDNKRATGIYATKGQHNQAELFFPADIVIANATPWNLNMLLGANSPSKLQREANKRANGWGAFVLHLGVRTEAIPEGFPDHHQIVEDMESPLGETHSIFVSISPAWDRKRAPAGQRALTITTHTEVNSWWDLREQDMNIYKDRKDEYVQRILRVMERILPDIRNNITLVMSGTPVTYNTYTLRHLGMVGGFPQKSLFRARSPRTGIENLRLVGDSIFPGQSTAGVTLGALRVAADIKRSFPLSENNHSPESAYVEVEQLSASAHE